MFPNPPSPPSATRKGRRLFGPERFPYNPAQDTYQCPAGQSLDHSADYGRPDHRLAYYQNRNACRRCPIRRHCTTGLYRTIVRSPHQAAIERAAQRAQDHRHLLQKRKGLAEPVFGLLRLWGHDRFLLRRLEKVRAEFSLSALTYNLRRLLNLVGVGGLLAALA